MSLLDRGMDITEVIHTRAANENSLANSQFALRANHEAWKPMEDKLLSWALDPSALDDGELPFPSLEVIKVANSLALELRQRGAIPPSRIVPDGDGGITFEWRDANNSLYTKISSSGTVRTLSFVGDRLAQKF